MPITDRQRRMAHARLEEVLGVETADVLMELVPLQPHSDLVTRTDMQGNTIALRGEMRGMGADLRTEMAELRTELRDDMAELKTELRTDMAELGTELRTDMAELRAEVRREIAGLQRWGAGVVAANAIIVITVLLAG